MPLAKAGGLVLSWGRAAFRGRGRAKGESPVSLRARGMRVGVGRLRHLGMPLVRLWIPA